MLLNWPETVKSVAASGFDTLAFKFPTAAEQARLGRLVALQAAEHAVIDEQLRLVCLCASSVEQFCLRRTKVQGGELGVDNTVVPVDVAEVRRRSCHNGIRKRGREELIQDIAADEEIRGAVGQLVRVPKDTLVNDGRTGLHMGKGLLRLRQLPNIRRPVGDSYDFVAPLEELRMPASNAPARSKMNWTKSRLRS